MRLIKYSLVTYINTCSCGREQRFNEFHALYRTNHSEHWTIVKPGATVYSVNHGEIETELRRMATRACVECLPTLVLQPWVEENKVVGTGITPRKPQTITLQDLEGLL